VLFDQPQVVANAEPILRAAGVSERCQIVGGNFFEAVPAGGDAYVLKHVLHGWDDEQANRILRQCRRAMGSTGTLLIVERVLGPPNEDSPGKISDLNMLVAAEDGRERTRDEWAALLARAGFRVVGITPTATAGMQSLIEGSPA
jgi:L-alanine-DL-glutamate epimerase-like enolase superfamily enzyme